MKKFAFFSTLVLTAIFASATPPNTPVLDGRPIEYDATDLRAVFGAEPAWTTVTVSNLFVTWDATNLYIGYQAWLQSDKLVVIIDADPDAAPPTGATTTTNLDWKRRRFSGIYQVQRIRLDGHPGPLRIGLHAGQRRNL